MNKLAEILNSSAVSAAQRLLGCELRRELNGHILRARIVETEAYDQTDEASHSYSGVLGASAASASQSQQQSDNFFRRKIGGATFHQKKIASSPLKLPFETQQKPRRRQGQTARTDVMFGPAGHLYVYFTYGMHYCCNVVVGQEGHGAAVLIRAVEPLRGHEIMSQNRHGLSGETLTNGPAKLCQAFQIDKALNGHDLSESPLKLIIKPPLDQKNIVQTARIGIARAKEVPWRFYEKDNIFVSRRA
jgi:DNA-3-methyladenine glycosylase